ncbi:MAG TPA: MgtC/SapB family protein [Ilumatobacteraceae bacterium]|nr:MgtC/SapB family protein [Ilumatobacteraceae bacterium]
MSISTMELLLRLLAAAGLGIVVGLERDVSGRAAGARTNAVVALGAALFTVAGAYGFADHPANADGIDPTRIAAQVAAGVGFIGAGAIIRHGTGVKGVTTAATVWLAAAIGVMCGAGGYLAAALTATLAVLVLLLLRVVKPILLRVGRAHGDLLVVYERGHGTIGPLLRQIADLGGAVEQISVEDEGDSEHGRRTVNLEVAMPSRGAADEVVQMLEALPEVRKVGFSHES